MVGAKRFLNYNMFVVFFKFIQCNTREERAIRLGCGHVVKQLRRATVRRTLLNSISQSHCISHLWTNQVFTRKSPQTQQHTKHCTRSLGRWTLAEEDPVWWERLSQEINDKALARLSDDNHLSVGYRSSTAQRALGEGLRTVPKAS